MAGPHRRCVQSVSDTPNLYLLMRRVWLFESVNMDAEMKSKRFHDTFISRDWWLHQWSLQYIHIGKTFFSILWYWTHQYQLFPPVIHRNLKKKIQNKCTIFWHIWCGGHLLAPSVEVVLPASLMISAIQYTLVERLVSELTTSILTPSSMSPQHVPMGAWSAEEAVKLLRQESDKLVVATYSTTVFTHVLETADWSSSRVIATDVPTPVKALCRDHWQTQETV